MRTMPNDDDDRQDLDRIKAEPWMVDCLALNPDYVFWGPHEDYMMGKRGGWSDPIFEDSWSVFSLGLDDLNEVVNFYFEVDRDSEQCASCGGSGLNRETKKISDDWYDFDGTGRRWCDKITQDEVQALLDNHRLWDFKGKTPTADEVNAWSRRPRSLGHDGINQWICVKTRANRLGVYGKCPECGGHGSIFTAPAATLRLVLWLIHPRKGAGRGVEVKRVERDDLPAVFRFLRKAAERNAQRFSKIPTE